MRKQVKHITAREEDKGQRIDNYLMKRFKGVPKSRIYQMIRKGEVRVNGKRIGAHYKLNTGDELRIPPVASRQQRQPRPPDDFLQRLKRNIIYEDESILILNKPAGIAVHKGSGLQYGIVDGLAWLDDRYHSVSLVHRIDKETSGCLLLARNRPVVKELHRQLREGEVVKYYRALLKGYWPESREINAPLQKVTKPNGDYRMVVAPNGQSAVTRFNPQRWFEKATFVEVELVTGRMHQIRAHAGFAGHPVAGDYKYGNPEFNQLMKQQGLKRMFLHASYVGFVHPKTGQWFEIVAPMEKTLLKVLERLS